MSRGAADAAGADVMGASEPSPLRRLEAILTFSLAREVAGGHIERDRTVATGLAIVAACNVAQRHGGDLCAQLAALLLRACEINGRDVHAEIAKQVRIVAAVEADEVAMGAELLAGRSA